MVVKTPGCKNPWLKEILDARLLEVTPLHVRRLDVTPPYVRPMVVRLLDLTPLYVGPLDIRTGCKTPERKTHGRRPPGCKTPGRKTPECKTPRLQKQNQHGTVLVCLITDSTLTEWLGYSIHSLQGMS